MELNLKKIWIISTFCSIAVYCCAPVQMLLLLLTTTLRRCRLIRLQVVGNSSAISQASPWLSNCRSSSQPIPLEEDPSMQLISNFDSFDSAEEVEEHGGVWLSAWRTVGQKRPHLPSRWTGPTCEPPSQGSKALPAQNGEASLPSDDAIRKSNNILIDP